MDERFEEIFKILPKKPESWNVADVSTWLAHLSMSKYQDIFSRKSLISGKLG